MTDFGGKLRQARERRGISLRQIAASTKISPAALEALERNDVSKLPGGIFSRAFVRSYAVEVGLNPDETVREFLEQFDREAPVAAAAPARLSEEESAFESQQRLAGVVLKLLLIAIPVGGAILYLTLRNRPAAPRAGTTAPSQVAAPAATPVSSAAPPPVAAPPVTPPPAAAALAPAAVMRLEIHPTGACWISLTVDGERVFARVMQAGETDVREVRDAAVIEVGDAGAFAFSIDGHPGRPLGEAGQVRSARITRDTMASFLR
jgi:cytoskeletal protein RodZ